MRFLNLLAVVFFCFFTLLNNPAQAGIFSAIMKASKTAKVAKVAKGGLAATGMGGAVKLFKTPDSKVLAISSHTDGIKLTDELGNAFDVPKGGLTSKLLNDKLLTGKYDEIFLDVNTMAHHPNLTKGLDKKLSIKLVIGDKAYPIRRNGSHTDLMVNENVAIPLPTATAGFRTSINNTLHFLNRPFNKSNVRPLRFDNAAPVNSVKKIGTKTNGVPDVDAINPNTLDTSLAYLRGQQAIVSGKFNGEFLEVAAGGKTTKIPFETLKEAAARNKVQLTILDTASAKQPGSKGLFGTKKLKGLDKAMTAKTQKEFFDALSPGKDQPFVVRQVNSDSARAQFSIETRAPPKNTTTLSKTGDDSSSNFLYLPTGNMTSYFNSREYDKEQDARIIPWLPSKLQFYFLGSFLLGLLAYSRSKSVFDKLWPMSSKERKAFPPFKRTVYLGLKSIAFFLIWLPLTGCIWFTIEVVVRVYQTIMSVIRFVLSPFMWVFRKFSPS